ncbi:restriction endonuclease subunit S [Clostridium botulinum]|nr:restriction endonuclease subunit S [Clostridium botulinum]MBN1070761.1 restriction endonuclease subunit S [Clostridium botulinum]
MFKSQYMQQRIFDKAKGSAILNMVGVAVLKQMLIPVPPLSEQKRIVEKVDSLMALCDELEKIIQE